MPWVQVRGQKPQPTARKGELAEARRGAAGAAVLTHSAVGEAVGTGALSRFVVGRGLVW